MKKLNFSAFKFDLTLDDRYPLFWKHLFYSAEILAKTNSRLLFCLALVWVLFFSLSNCFVFHTAEIFRHGRSHILFSVVAHHSTFLSKLIRSTTKIHTRKMSSNESVKRKRGAFLLFEGVDRCGKTTQSKLLTEHLNRINGEDSCIPMRFPDRTTTIGKIIDSYLTSKTDLNDHSIHLLFSANRWERKQYIEESLRNGQSIVCDRYAYSGVAFTSAKGLDLSWCQTCDQGLPAPDAIIYLDILPEEAATRGQFGEERYEKLEFQRTVREQYMKLKEIDERNRSIPWFVIDAKRSIDEIHEDIKRVSNEILEKTAGLEVKELWTSIH